jgi:ribonuclease Z
MIDILFLGTGCMQPTKQRNHAAILLRFNKENLLFDCGEGTQRQMRIAGFKPAKITRLFISHWHGDHVFGIPGLLSSMGADQFTEKLEIYGPKGSKKYLSNLFKSFAAKDIIPYEVHEISSGKIFDNEEFMVEAYPLKHSVPCMGYSFIEKERRRINVAKAKKLSLEGPILGKLQKGKSVVVNGIKIESEEVTYLVPAKKISYVTDTTECDGANTLAKDADLLILEGTLLDELEENAIKSKHLTVKQAAIIASENNAKKLILTHISQRYKNSSEIIDEAKNYFDNTVVAEDFMKLKI